jgi:orotate phosphoribosyltransferase
MSNNRYFSDVSEAILTSPGVFRSIAQTPAILKCRQVSPYYLNTHFIWSDKNGKNITADCMYKMIMDVMGWKKIDRLTTTEAKGLLVATEIGTRSRLDLPVTFVRKAEKGYGGSSGGLVEGIINPGEYVLPADDLITEALSAEVCVNAVRSEKGGIIDKYFVVFDRKQGGDGRLGKMGVQVYSPAFMCPEFIEQIKKFRRGKDVSDDDLAVFRGYAEDPVVWSRQYLMDHPEFVENQLRKAVKDGEIKSNAPVLEIFTEETGHPELMDEFRERICGWLKDAGAKNKVEKFGYDGLGQTI